MRLFHLACILVYLMNIKQIIPEITTSNESTTTLTEACCTTTKHTENISINTSFDIPVVRIGLTNSNPFSFLFSKGSRLESPDSLLIIMVPLIYYLNFII